MACTSEALEQSVARCQQLAERLMERMEILEGRILRPTEPHADRLEALEQKLQQKVDAKQCREVVAEALRPFEAWIEDFAALACRRPRLAPSPFAEAAPPEPTPEQRPHAPAAEQEKPPRPLAHADIGGQRDVDADDSGQRPNAPLSVVVEFRRAAGRADEVTLDIRSFDRISSLKEKALEQLEVWGRFCRIGQLAEDDQSDEDEDDSSTAALALPPLSACRLYAAEAKGGGRRALREQDSVAESRLQHGMRLCLVAESAWPKAPAQSPASPTRAPAPAPAQPLSPEKVAPPPGSEEDEDAAASNFSSSGGQSGPISVVVAHNAGEVTVEARTSDPVQKLKCRAHAQLSVWYRFCDISDSPSSALPPLEECQLWTSGPDGGAVALLGERSPLEECSLSTGQKLLLRARA